MTALSSATSFGTAVSPPAADSGAPVSYVQEELWLLDRLSPQGTAHNRPMFVRITVSSGTLDVPALQRALDEIVRRHEVLRTAFPMTEGQPMQVVLPGAAVPLSIVDVSGAPGDPGRPGNPVASAVPGATVMSQATQEMEQHFDLEGGSLIRARLFRFGDRDHLLMIVVHEIAFDEPSADILLRELSALYTAFASGLPSPLPDLPLRYADFARLQRQDAEDGRLENSLAYWKQQLGGKIPSTDLPIGRRGQPGRALTAARQTIDLSPDLCRTLGALDRDDLFVTLVGCLTTLLNRYSGEDDTVIGSLWVNREHRGSERLIGNFSNTLVLRTRLAGDPTAREVCGRIREVIDGARAHSAIPFVKLLELARPERDGSMAPLSRVMFVLDAASPLVASAAGVTMRRDEVAIPTPKLDLTLRVSVGDQAIRASIDYYEELFDAPAISRVLEHYVNLLEAIVGHPDQPISTLPFLTKTERHVLLEDWGGRPSTASEFSGIHRAFEAWADRTPDAVALFVGTERLTYRELNQRANQLARHLRDLGVGPEVPVGICVGRSARMVEGILAILKAGGAYVPLDPAYPKDRLAFMVRDAGVPVLLLEQATAGSISGSPARSVFLDTDRAQISRLSDRNLEEPISAQSAAYIIYTSGSTGDPRGVVVTHANVCHYVEAVRVPMDLTSDDKYLHTASFSFSSSARQLMVPLSHGATVVVATFEQIQDPIALLELVKQRAVTIMDLVPSYWRSCTHAVSSLGAEARAAALDNKLRLILSASEPLLSDLPRTWKVEFAHPARLINMFGQTETTGIVSCYPIPDEADDRVTVVSIGRPIANTRVYLLDKHLHPVPIGVVGEVFIGGAGVGRGYLNQPALTAERFIPDPFGTDPGSRLYKTGDLGRYRSDGNLEFLGRRDHQVKIRGARVEIGEIEAVLGQHPDIRQGVVVPRESATGDTRLVAYIVPGRASVPGASELRGFLRQRLPEPMVPSTFVVVNALPLTPTGKVDRRALPAPDHERPAEGAAFVGPRNPLESELALMWEELLNVRPVGIKDNFFDLGGHSLLAIRMLQRIEEVSGTRLPPSVLFDGATVDHLARVLTQADRHDYRSPVVTIQDEGSRTPVFFVTGDYKGGGFYCINLSRYLGTDQPFHVLPCHGFNGDEVPRTVEEMAISHLTGLRAFQPHGPYILGGYCNSALVAFEMARRLQADGEPVELVILIESVMHSDRLRVLHRLLQRLDSWIGLSPERVIRWHYRLKWYGGRLEDVGRLGSRERLALVADRATRGIRALGALGKNGRQREGGPASPAPVRFSNQLADTHEEFVELCHRRAAAGFVPRPYPGRVVLMRAEETALMRSDDPTNGWRRVAEDCEVHSIPGGHVTALTRHTEVVAQKVNACLGRKHEGSSVRCEKLPDGDKSYPNG